MSRDQLVDLQQKQLRKLVEHVIVHVPYYQKWARVSGFRAGAPFQIEDLPIVSKADYFADIDAFQSDAYPLRQMVLTKTSGSSGEPFAFRVHRESVDYTYCCLWRGLQWRDVHPGDRRVYIWGQSWEFATAGLFGKISKQSQLAVRNWLNCTLFVNAYRLNEANVARVFKNIQRFRLIYMHGYVSALYMIALHMQTHNLQFDFPLKAIVTESEKLYDFQRRAMEAAFGCPVVENYGSVEFGMLAAQDCQGHMRIHDDMHLVEQMPGTGEAVITNLRSHAFPFIRYRLGDIIELSPHVPDKMPYRVLTKILGRTVDLIPLVSGGFMPGVSLPHVIDPHLIYVYRYQIHQAAIDRFIIRLVLRQPLPETARQKIIADMKHLLGNQVNVQIEIVDSIPVALSGKFRWVTTDVSDAAQKPPLNPPRQPGLRREWHMMPQFIRRYTRFPPVPNPSGPCLPPAISVFKPPLLTTINSMPLFPPRSASYLPPPTLQS